MGMGKRWPLSPLCLSVVALLDRILRHHKAEVPSWEHDYFNDKNMCHGGGGWGGLVMTIAGPKNAERFSVVLYVCYKMKL